MLKQTQFYLEQNPLAAWLIGVAVCSTCNGIGSLISGWINPLYFLSMSVVLPTFMMVWRSVANAELMARAGNEQDKQIGLCATISVAGSILLLTAHVLCKYVGIGLPMRAGIWMLTGYGVLLMLALLLGFYARRTQIGLWSFSIAVGWLALIVIIGFGSLLIKG